MQSSKLSNSTDKVIRSGPRDLAHSALYSGSVVPRQRLEEDPAGLTESLLSDLSSHQSLGISSGTGLCFIFLGSLKGKRCICFKQTKKNPFSSVSSCTFFIQLFNHLSKHPLSTRHIASPGNTKTLNTTPVTGEVPSQQRRQVSTQSCHTTARSGLSEKQISSAQQAFSGGTEGWLSKVARADLGEPLLIILCPPRKQPQGGKRRAT